MNQKMTVQEQVSALADGQLHGAEFAEAVDRLCADDALRAAWQTYHVVGDVLRSGGHATCSNTASFLARFQSRLAAEPATPATVVPLPARIPQPAQHRAEAANEPVFRWKLVAGCASLAAAAAIGWNWVGVADPGPAGAQLAQQSTAPPVVAVAELPRPTPAPAAGLSASRVIIGNGNPQVMLRDPRLDQLLEAHQQVAGSSQMPSGFLRNATFDRPSR